MKRFIVLSLFIFSCVTQIYTIGATSNAYSSETLVYICETGKVYHSTKSCRGLSNATHKLESIPLSEAKKTRRACKICY